jgi:hypothetical protein
MTTPVISRLVYGPFVPILVSAQPLHEAGAAALHSNTTGGST